MRELIYEEILKCQDEIEQNSPPKEKVMLYQQKQDVSNYEPEIMKMAKVESVQQEKAKNIEDLKG